MIIFLLLFFSGGMKELIIALATTMLPHIDDAFTSSQEFNFVNVTLRSLFVMN